MDILRSCADCGGHWLGHDSRSFGGVYRCPKHQAAHMNGFDPQRNDIVRYIDGPTGEFVVLAREGTSATLRPLGRPDAASVAVAVGRLHPRGY